MKLTNKRVKEILKVLGFGMAVEIESSFGGPRFRLGTMLIEMYETENTVEVSVRLLGSGSYDQKYYFLKKKGMFWQVSEDFYNVYDKENEEIIEKSRGKEYVYYSEETADMVGFYAESESTLHILDGWIPGQIDMRYKGYVEILRCIDRSKWQYESLGNYYNIVDRSII